MMPYAWYIASLLLHLRPSFVPSFSDLQVSYGKIPSCQVSSQHFAKPMYVRACSPIHPVCLSVCSAQISRCRMNLARRSAGSRENPTWSTIIRLDERMQCMTLECLDLKTIASQYEIHPSHWERLYIHHSYLSIRFSFIFGIFKWVVNIRMEKIRCARITMPVGWVAYVAKLG